MTTSTVSKNLLTSDPFFPTVIFQPLALTGNTGADKSGNAATITNTGATTTNSIVKQDAYSWSFNGTSQYFTVPSNATYALSGDFTIECWFYMTATNLYPSIICCTVSGATAWSLAFSASTSTPIFAHLTVSTVILSAGGNVSLNAWHHFAVTRQSGLATLWIDGVNQGTATDATSYVNSGITVGVGTTAAGAPAASEYFSGSVCGIRVSKFARYAANFSNSLPLTTFDIS